MLKFCPLCVRGAKRLALRGAGLYNYSCAVHAGAQSARKKHVKTHMPVPRAEAARGLSKSMAKAAVMRADRCIFRQKTGKAGQNTPKMR